MIRVKLQCIDNMRYISYNVCEVDVMKFKIIFYETPDGKVPARDFMCGLDSKMRAKIAGLIEVLSDKGTALREPYTKHLDDGIFELRCRLGSNITRTLYFFYTGGKIVLTNGFVKKSIKTPPSMIDIAKKYRTDFFSRQEAQS